MALTLWHNPRCPTSRRAVGLLEDKGAQFTLRLSLNDPPTRAELSAPCLPARALLRHKDAPEAADYTEDLIFDLLAEHPQLIERPILLTAKGSAIGRPPEALLALL